MAYAPSAVAPRDFAPTHVPASNGRRLLRRFFDAMMASRQRQVDREIALYIHGMGGKFTDDIEREIERRFLSTSSRW
jgi:hypothetical protein